MKKNVNILITISTLFNDKIQINIKRGKMIVEKFNLMQYSVHAILGLIDAEDFVIPEIQRPFVWKRSQVRDLIDSLATKTKVNISVSLGAGSKNILLHGKTQM